MWMVNLLDFSLVAYCSWAYLLEIRATKAYVEHKDKYGREAWNWKGDSWNSWMTLLCC